MSEAQEKAVIRTPDRRLRVFVSSALEELAEERRAVARAISALRRCSGRGRPHPAPPDVYRAYLYRTFSGPAELGQLVRDDLAEAAAPRPPSSPG